jgi:hypothetical protein
MSGDGASRPRPPELWFPSASGVCGNVDRPFPWFLDGLCARICAVCAADPVEAARSLDSMPSDLDACTLLLVLLCADDHELESVITAERTVAAVRINSFMDRCLGGKEEAFGLMMERSLAGRPPPALSVDDCGGMTSAVLEAFVAAHGIGWRKPQTVRAVPFERTLRAVGTRSVVVSRGMAYLTYADCAEFLLESAVSSWRTLPRLRSFWGLSDEIRALLLDCRDLPIVHGQPRRSAPAIGRPRAGAPPLEDCAKNAPLCLLRLRRRLAERGHLPHGERLQLCKIVFDLGHGTKDIIPVVERLTGGGRSPSKETAAELAGWAETMTKRPRRECWKCCYASSGGFRAPGSRADDRAGCPYARVGRQESMDTLLWSGLPRERIDFVMQDSPSVGPITRCRRHLSVLRERAGWTGGAVWAPFVYPDGFVRAACDRPPDGGGPRPTAGLQRPVAQNARPTERGNTGVKRER